MRLLHSVAFLISVFIVISCGNRISGNVPDSSADGGDSGSDADTDVDSDGDSDTDADSDSEDGGSGFTCPDGAWFDESSGLCWQNPPIEIAVQWQNAMDYCSSLEFEGTTDWQLPKIQELISLSQGCTTVDCGVSEPECLVESCLFDDINCYPCESGSGPGPAGCYWNNSLTGVCDAIYWSSSLAEGTINEQAWSMDYYVSSPMMINTFQESHFRCVHYSD